MSGVKVLS